MAERSKLTKYLQGHWTDIPVRPYKDASDRHRGVTRQEILGGADDERALSVVVRYFEIAPGGYSSLERHDHPHAVVIVRGTGIVVLDGDTLQVAPHDCVYVAPRSLHQFQASDTEPLGFLCIVDRVRDRPETPSPAEVEGLLAKGVLVKPNPNPS